MVNGSSSNEFFVVVKESFEMVVLGLETEAISREHTCAAEEQHAPEEDCHGDDLAGRRFTGRVKLPNADGEDRNKDGV